MRYVLHARWLLPEASDQIGLNTVSYLSHGGREYEPALSRKATGASYLSSYAATGSHNSVDSEDELKKVAPAVKHLVDTFARVCQWSVERPIVRSAHYTYTLPGTPPPRAHVEVGADMTRVRPIERVTIL